MRPQRRQPTRLPRPWDSPGKNTGVGCHFLLQSMKVKSESEVAQSRPTLRDPMDCSLPGSSVHRIFQVRVLEWGAIAFSLKQARHPNFGPWCSSTATSISPSLHPSAPPLQANLSHSPIPRPCPMSSSLLPPSSAGSSIYKHAQAFHYR